MKISNKNTYPSMIIASNVVSPSSLGLKKRQRNIKIEDNSKCLFFN